MRRGQTMYLLIGDNWSLIFYQANECEWHRMVIIVSTFNWKQLLAPQNQPWQIMELVSSKLGWDFYCTPTPNDSSFIFSCIQSLLVSDYFRQKAFCFFFCCKTITTETDAFVLLRNRAELSKKKRSKKQMQLVIRICIEKVNHRCTKTFADLMCVLCAVGKLFALATSILYS